jgi:threonine synthase
MKSGLKVNINPSRGNNSMAFEVQCTNCHQPYPEVGAPYCCPRCGGIFDFTEIWHINPQTQSLEDRGMWRYKPALGLTEAAPIVTLGEGNTPLIWTTYEQTGNKSIKVGLKCEFLNPTGSFKDRGSALIVSFLLSRGIGDLMEDSSGNAGASLAAYAARAGVRAHIFIPESASGPKQTQIEAYGAELIRIPGSRSDVSHAVKESADRIQPGNHEAYASHAYLPFNIPGYASIAYELFEQMAGVPGTVLAPVGQGGLILGIARGFLALQKAGLISHLPVLVGVQARACAPIWALTTYGVAGFSLVMEGETIAEGIRVRYPLRGDPVIRTVEESGGFFVAVDDENIHIAQRDLANKGVYVEPTSAVVWAALPQILERTSPPYIGILTGSGYKFRE